MSLTARRSQMMRGTPTMVRMIAGVTIALTLALANAKGDKSQEDGFTSLFDGQTLQGWQGAIDGYQVENEAIVCIPEKGGNLYTEKQYGDFVIRFEFKLTSGANNGLGIRAPLKGQPAFEGYEIQILDNTADKYKNLKVYQYHGSVYGLVPAKRGFLKPLGQWNTQEVTCRGDHFTVKLNGETIVDADVAQASTPKTLDGRDHPGLKRDQGHIALCGHGSRVDFRNVRIKELK